MCVCARLKLCVSGNHTQNTEQLFWDLFFCFDPCFFPGLHFFPLFPFEWPTFFVVVVLFMCMFLFFFLSL